jgi:hypothetical protein
MSQTSSTRGAAITTAFRKVLSYSSGSTGSIGACPRVAVCWEVEPFASPARESGRTSFTFKISREWPRAGRVLRGQCRVSPMLHANGV